MKTIFLSHYINEETPLYGGEKAIEIECRSKISQGSSSNTKFLKFPNHTGTHIDFPNHFSEIGKTINDYPASFWTFKNVQIINFTAKAEEIIDKNVISNFNIYSKTEFLIINSGFGKHRENEIYWNNNPGLAPNLSKAIKTICPNLKVIGFDFISVSSYQNRLLGREAHKAFLIENDILLIEDMKLDELNGNEIASLTALPLMIDLIDGAPISIIAELK